MVGFFIGLLDFIGVLWVRRVVVDEKRWVESEDRREVVVGRGVIVVVV